MIKKYHIIIIKPLQSILAEYADAFVTLRILRTLIQFALEPDPYNSTINNENYKLGLLFTHLLQAY